MLAAEGFAQLTTLPNESSVSASSAPSLTNPQNDRDIHRDSLDTAHSIRSSTSSQKRTISMFNRVMGRRRNDYCADSARPQEISTPAPRGSKSSSGTGGALSGSANDGRGSSWISFAGRTFFTVNRSTDVLGAPDDDTFSHSFRCGTIRAEQRKMFFVRVVSSTFWRVLLIVFTIILFFGAEFRTLVLPKEADPYMDGIFTVVLVVFLVDIGMRIDVEPNYFSIHLYCCHSAPHEEKSIHGSCSNSCHFGSFIFYCELLSTLVLLSEISYVNTAKFSEQTLHIVLNRFGVPERGLADVNQAAPIETDTDLLLAVVKAARIARFLRSSAAETLASRINWYRLYNLIRPRAWINSCLCGFGRLSRTIETDTFDASSRGSLRSDSNGPEDGMLRRSSWGGVGLGVLAAIRAKAEAEEARKHDNWWKRLPHALGIVQRDTKRFKRHLAATKIQRAWRAVLSHRHLTEEGESERNETDVAWRGRVIAGNPVEKALMKKSFLNQYALQNNNGKRWGTRSVSDDGAEIPHRPLSSLARLGPSRSKIKVGATMRELTGQRVALGIMVALLVTVLFTYTESDATRPTAMIVLHNQTADPLFADRALDSTRSRCLPSLFYYKFEDGTNRSFDLEGEDINRLRGRERIRITITRNGGNSTVGLFSFKDELQESALITLSSTIFVLLVWFFGVTAFAGPVMILVVIPIERMVRLLGMLMRDPLGYQSNLRYKKFVAEENNITRNTRWTKDVLKGMETSFLMSTILRIGSLMKVGFGSAGVEIIRRNLERGQTKNMLDLNSQGSTVSCIFLFCDIRQFTDATECLQEEVFVFTNRIAGVVHSICHSYGGSANKNIGDAFLLSWILDESGDSGTMVSERTRGRARSGNDNFVADKNQADKALLSVVKICVALHYDEYYIKNMSDHARRSLIAKLSKRNGPVVQMGFGLHAGKAVQGAIGSQRKIDATYVSEAVERAEFLESSTKKYGVQMLLSDSFHRLLPPKTRGRCRKIDQVLVGREDENEEADYDGEQSWRII
jgi:class 3 adenylate cyclase